MKQVKGWWLPDTDTDIDRWILDGEYLKIQNIYSRAQVIGLD